MTLEERVAQLERVMLAQVSAQESEGYYMSKYSGEEIDSLLDSIKSNFTLVDTETQKSYSLLVESGVLKLREV